MPQFFDPKARVTFFVPTQPQGSVAIAIQPWQRLAADDDAPIGSPPLRKRHRTSRTLADEGIVHVSELTGERHTHGEIEEVDREPGMQRVIAENVIPQRPLDADAYLAFAKELRVSSYRLFQRQATKAISEATGLDKDPSSVVALYLPQP
jgi:hypothetical protein